MRVLIAILLAAIANLAVLAGPSLAKTPDAQNTSDQPSSPSCDGYEQNADGSWTHLPCREIGPDTRANPKTSARSADKTSH
jgi:hypothetical protein